MIKKLRRKFVLTTMGILTVSFAAVILVLNMFFYQMGNKQNFDFIKMLADTEGSPTHGADMDRDERAGAFGSYRQRNSSMTESPTYLAKLDAENNILSLEPIRGTEEEPDESISDIILRAAKKRSEQGTVGGYSYYRSTKVYGSCLVIMDTHDSVESAFARRLLLSSILVGSGALVLLFFVSLFLSRFVTKPAEETFNKQKQFISDASHELKTPLSVIGVNADVLSSEIGENKYITYIQTQVKRMDGLIRQLLDLAHNDDASRPVEKSCFDLSEAVYQALLPYESSAYERHIQYKMDIESPCTYCGEPEKIKQVVTILIDNAFKHTFENGEITVTLKTKGNERIIIVRNTGEGISDDDMKHIFERFYKCDKSRSEDSMSYGLGLSIAEAIVETHGGKIGCKSDGVSYSEFTVCL